MGNQGRERLRRADEANNGGGMLICLRALLFTRPETRAPWSPFSLFLSLIDSLPTPPLCHSPFHESFHSNSPSSSLTIDRFSDHSRIIRCYQWYLELRCRYHDRFFVEIIFFHLSDEESLTNYSIFGNKIRRFEFFF